MVLKEKISQDLTAALKSGQGDVIGTLRFLMSAIKNAELLKRTKLSKKGKPAAAPSDGASLAPLGREELEKLSELSDEEAISVMLGEIKKRKESIAQYEAGGRKDLVEKETAELEILKKYAPEEMPDEELRDLIKKKISEMGGVTMKEFGKIMGLIMAEVKNRAGGDLVKKIIEEELKQ